MKPSDPNSARIAAQLDRVMDGVSQFGSALGAMDHGGPVEELEESGHEIIRGAFERAPELHTLLPRLAAKLKAGKSVADDGYDIRDEVAEARKQLEKGDDRHSPAGA